MKIAVKAMALVLSLFLVGCGGDSNNSTQSDSSATSQTNHETANLIREYTIPTAYGCNGTNVFVDFEDGDTLKVHDWDDCPNVLLDGDNLILAGGQTGQPAGATYDGSPLFSNKVIKLNLLDGSKEVLEMNATTGHFFEGGDKGNGGRGNFTTKIYKLDENKYLISGGFQYVNNVEIIDFNMNKVTKITTSFYTNGEGSAMDNEGNIYWFGYDGGLYNRGSIMKFDKQSERLQIINTNLTMPRSSVFAQKISSGKIMLIGGADGTSDITSDSASRRVELFDPESLTIKRLADFPTPRNYFKLIDGDDKICALSIGSEDKKYQYSISNDTWKTGCDLNGSLISDENIIIPDYLKQGGYQVRYFGKLSNGNVVLGINGTYGHFYSDTIGGYPLETNTTIDIFEIQ